MLILADYIGRFGAQAVMGRPMGAGEMRRIVVAENIVNAYRSRQATGNWARWSDENPDAAALLNDAMKAANDGR